MTTNRSYGGGSSTSRLDLIRQTCEDTPVTNQPTPVRITKKPVAPVLEKLLKAQGRKVRPGQGAAAEHFDSESQHAAAMCPTGVGKSALAIAASVAAGGGIVAVNSNGLVAQYVAEIPEWEEALDIKIAPLVGRAHYWCPKASPTLEGFSPEAKAHVTETGTFIGAGVDKAVYERHSVVALAPEVDEDEDGELKAKSPCTECPIRKSGACPLWNAREAAGNADVVITNATMLGVSIKGQTDWAQSALKPLIVLDEADSCREPLTQVLGAQITIKAEEDIFDLEGALKLVQAWAADEEDKNSKSARRFLSNKRFADEEGRKVVFNREDTGKVVLTIPADLRVTFADKNVIAMSATLSQRNVDDLGLNTKVAAFQGLDVSASLVTVQEDAPGWKWGQDGPPAAWSAHVANELSEAFRQGGRTLGLFQSYDDLNAVVAKLPADVRAAMLLYSPKTDRTTVVKTYTANPDKHLIIGLVQGAGRGLNLPGELLRKVVVARVPQFPPKNADRAIWLEDSRAAITQSVGRAHRHDGDWGNVTIVGGFGRRKDVKDALVKLGWRIADGSFS